MFEGRRGAVCSTSDS